MAPTAFAAAVAAGAVAAAAPTVGGSVSTSGGGSSRGCGGDGAAASESSRRPSSAAAAPAALVRGSASSARDRRCVKHCRSSPTGRAGRRGRRALSRSPAGCGPPLDGSRHPPRRRAGSGWAAAPARGSVLASAARRAAALSVLARALEWPWRLCVGAGAVAATRWAQVHAGYAAAAPAHAVRSGTRSREGPGAGAALRA